MTASEIVDPLHLMRFAADVVLRNGTTLRLRPVFAADAPRVLEFLEHLSRESLELRFCSPRVPDEKMAKEMAVSDPETTFGLAGEFDERIVAIAHYYRTAPGGDRAEVAFTIADGMQGLGVGTRLLERLADVGRQYGIRLFEAEVSPTNYAMMKVFLDSGFELQESASGRHFEMLIEPTESYEDRSSDRARQAATASMKALFEPRSIAVIGAGRHPRHLGAELFNNLMRFGFKGRLHPVNPTAKEIQYVPAYPTVQDVPGEVDLAFIAVPAGEVEKVIDDCIEKKVRAVVVMTGGFSEAGAEGHARELRLVEKIRSAGIRMVGPNAMGLLNTDPSISLHGTFAEMEAPPGNVAMSTQSGALGLATLDYARQLNIGFSTFISVGNKADVSGNDLIQYWADDPRTEVILLYLESFGNPKKFARIAPRVARKKPIVAVKSGRSQTGARAALRHSGATLASDTVVANLFRQAGIIRTDTLEEMFDVAMLLANQPLPRGPRVAIVTNAGGPAVLAADACEARGLQLASLSSETVEELRAFIPEPAAIENPVNLSPDSPAERYWRTMEVLLDDPDVDSLLVIHIPVFAEDTESVVRGIKEGAATSNGKPVVGTIMSAQGIPEELAPLPCFPFPERAAAALARITTYAEWRRRPVGRMRRFDDINANGIREIVRRAAAERAAWLPPEDARKLLALAGIRVLEAVHVATPKEAIAAAERIGFPVVLKAMVSSLRREVETASVREAISAGDVREVWDDMHERFGTRLRQIVVQKLVEEGMEVMIGVTEQPTFGHLLFYGSAASDCFLTPEVAFRFHPITDVDAADLMREVRATTMLLQNPETTDGVPEIEEMLLRLSAILDGCPEIREIEISPFRFIGSRPLALEAHVRVGAPEPNGSARRIQY
ncbi:MAG: GNAT family N-acetyltransferase [Thermoanaerobaculia bacterium]